MSNVYLIQNIENNYLYVGKARFPVKRWRRHQNDALHQKSHTYFHRALRAYGVDKFKLLILETFDTDTEAMDAEEFWIGYFRLLGASLYNISSGGDGFTHGEKTKQKISQYQKNRPKLVTHKLKIGLGNKGVPRPAKSPEAQAARSRGGKIASANNVGKKQSKEACLNMSLAHLGKPWSALRRARFEARKLVKSNDQATE